MTKKIFLLVLTTLMGLGRVVAQNAVGDWQIHTSFVGTEVLSVAESNDWVYYLTGGTPRIINDSEGSHSVRVLEGNLFRLDKVTDENESLSLVNGLSDMSIKQIYYNNDKDYLVVVYSNSNIDIIKTDGAVVNMPEIKDAVMTASKSINDVTFADGLIYLATDFGYAVIDDRKFVIKESHLYGKPILSAAQLGDMLLLSTADGIYYGDADKYYEQLSSFSLNKSMSNGRIFPLNDDTFFRVTSKTRLATMTIDDEGKVTFNEHDIIQAQSTVMQKTISDGYLLNVPKQGKCYVTDEDGDIVEEFETTELCSAHPNGDGKPWAVGPKGLHKFGQENYYLPNALSFSSPLWMTYNKGKDMLYVSTPTANAFYKSMTMQSEVNTFDGIRWKNVTPEGFPKSGTYWLEFLPDDDDTYFMGGWTTGLYKVTNDEIVMKYNADNSPLVKYSGAMHPITSIDRNGNVWVVQSLENPDHPVMVLPAAKAKLNQTTAADWILPDIEEVFTGHTQQASFLSTRYSNYDIKIFTDGDFEMPIVFWNSAGDPSLLNPERVSYTKLLDQDGQYFSWTNILCLTEDLNGTVWMGTTEGIVSFNPAKAFSGDFRVNHIKVPRNDGTGMADYLLDGIRINGIAVDGANRKWIATQNSGLFLVSADGTQIINKFNATNSPLASNTVYKVCCNPNSNSVYVTTPEGLYEYFSDSSPAEPNYNNIYAYPNPVRPDFGGNVTITGMMDNSLIKIADASGVVIRQMKSTGGMATWDCCDQYGERVKTGVYMVLCSQANGSGQAVVTKIAVIR